MRLASLYSGGKDSSFSLYLAEQMGHDVPYIVNIRPGKGSWIFHVPNQDMVPLLARSMKKTLRTVSTDGTEEGDMNALRSALSGLDVEGVVIGAVWSDYQWERINTVCGELGLNVFAPLWRKDQRIVMNELIDSGIEAVVVGAYADGLSEKWLGRTIDRHAEKELLALSGRYGISIIGEGGEYESLTLDSPMQDSALRINRSEKEWKNGAGTMTVTDAVLVPKDRN